MTATTRRTVGQGHPCAECDAEAVVGLGQPPVWLCLTHFDGRLKPIGKAVRKMAEELRRAT